MSAETASWLNNFTLIGQTDRRGTAWHYREKDQGAESNHYPGFIPVPDVIRRLFRWGVQEAQVFAEYAIVNEDGVESVRIAGDGRKAMCRPPKALSESDMGAILGLFKKGYEGHSYKEWLVEQVSLLLDDDLGITSAGLLAGGGQAWVEVSVPDSITTPEGVVFRPNLLCTTSFDGTLATTYKRSINDTVCDNTRAMVLAGAGEVFRVKHTKNSSLKLQDARDALALVHTIGEEFAAEVEVLCATTVTNAQWAKFLDELSPLKDEKDEPKTGRALTLATKKRDELDRLWNHDERVKPWKNSAHGAIQAVNTWAHHVQSIKGEDRSGRNMQMAAHGKFDALDNETIKTLGKVLQPA